jgi:hypothetical protein
VATTAGSKQSASSLSSRGRTELHEHGLSLVRTERERIRGHFTRRDCPQPVARCELRYELTDPPRAPESTAHAHLDHGSCPGAWRVAVRQERLARDKREHLLGVAVLRYQTGGSQKASISPRLWSSVVRCPERAEVI